MIKTFKDLISYIEAHGVDERACCYKFLAKGVDDKLFSMLEEFEKKGNDIQEYVQGKTEFWAKENKDS